MSSFKIINSSAVIQNVDAIVNAANRYLMSGGGICGEIFKNAGYNELNDECKKIKTPLNDGDAVITSSCNINNCKYIIHSVGPNFNENPNSIDKLYNAYLNSLNLLKKYNLHSISFPLISSGIFSGNIDNPVLLSTNCCIKAYNDFIKLNTNYDINVLLCAYGVNEYNEAVKVLDKYNGLS